MLENTLKPLLNGLILVMALFLAPLAGGTGLTTHQNHGKTYYYDGRQIPYYNSSRYGAWDRGSGYRMPREDYGYSPDRGYSHDQGYSHGYYPPPYRGRTYYPYNPQTTHENTVPPGQGTQDYYQGYDQGYHDGYRDTPKPYSGGVIYRYKGPQW